MEYLKGRKVLMVIAPDKFRDEEYFKPKELLEEAGAEITTSAKGVKESRGMLGQVAKIDLDLSKARAHDFEAVVFVGGSGCAVYFADGEALGLAKETFDLGKVIGAICIAPSVLANAGILVGKRATCFSSEKENLIAKGATYTALEVEQDGKIITASGPEVAQEFGKLLVSVLAKG